MFANLTHKSIHETYWLSCCLRKSSSRCFVKCMNGGPPHRDRSLNQRSNILLIRALRSAPVSPDVFWLQHSACASKQTRRLFKAAGFCRRNHPLKSQWRRRDSVNLAFDQRRPALKSSNAFSAFWSDLQKNTNPDFVFLHWVEEVGLNFQALSQICWVSLNHWGWYYCVFSPTRGFYLLRRSKGY